uniref:Taste receptor type 2 n=1 Tax=Pogona vitticeps TaxID=103695 RepID=A0ABM5FHX6_9SAUR
MIVLTSPLDFLAWTILGIIIVISLLGNGFIVFVNGYRWLRNRRIDLCDILLTALSTPRCLLQFVFLMNYSLYFTPPEAYFSMYRKEIISLSWYFLDTISLWCNTWLNVFYCVKVTNFPNRLFLWLKTRINALTLKLLGVSIILSMIFSLPSTISYYDQKKWCNRTGMQPLNASQSKVCRYIGTVLLPPQLSVFLINFIMNITACILLLTSLWQHTRNMRKSNIGFKDLNTWVHVNVIKQLIFHVFFYFLYFVGMAIYTGSMLNLGPMAEMASDILMCLLPFSHSIILILTNPKLKTSYARILKFRWRVS